MVLGHIGKKERAVLYGTRLSVVQRRGRWRCRINRFVKCEMWEKEETGRRTSLLLVVLFVSAAGAAKVYDAIGRKTQTCKRHRKKKKNVVLSYNNNNKHPAEVKALCRSDKISCGNLNQNYQRKSVLFLLQYPSNWIWLNQILCRASERESCKNLSSNGVYVCVCVCESVQCLIGK